MVVRMVADSDGRFSTFCHISEYVTESVDFDPHDGYQNLHRMIAASSPLNLWSPSSHYLRRTNCQVSARDFVSLVEDGYVRVLGRRAWIYNVDGFRDNHDWPGARWDGYVDGAIRAIHESEDRARTPDAARRVVVARDEQGYQSARELLAEHPEWIRPLYIAFLDRESGQIPPGTLEAVDRDLAKGRHGDAEEEVAAALTIMRDAHNHGEAAKDAGAEVPFLLSPHDSSFLQLLATLTGGGTPLTVDRFGNEVPPTTPSPEDQARLGVLTRQVVELLVRLDEMRGWRSLREDRSIRSWVGSEPHRLLVTWFQSLCQQIGNVRDEEVDGFLVHQLREELSRARFGVRWKRLLTGPELDATSLATLVDSLMRLPLAPTDPLGIADLALAALPIGRGLIKRLGFVSDVYTGNQWPYLYTFGKRPSRAGRRRLKAELGSAVR
jgi:hypothetical protein